jgi:RHS repeat-associated protein
MTELKDGEGNITKFSYDALGRLNKKTYADDSFYSYSYNARGWLTNRTDAASRDTRYTYNNAGQLIGIDYPTDTDVSYAYDALGRQTGRVDSAGTWSWNYEGESSRVLSETLNSSYLSCVSYSYNSNSFDLASMSCGSCTTLYSWSSGRMTSITVNCELGTLNFDYSYKQNSDLLETVNFEPGTLNLSVHRSYDPADRLLSVSNLCGTNLISSFTYTLDNCGRRIQRSDMIPFTGLPSASHGGAGGGLISYSYDQYDQLTSAVRTNGPNPALDAAYTYQYQYDEVGNRKHEDRGLLDLDGTFNPLNQLTALRFGGKLDIVGQVSGTNGPFTVKVDGENAAIFNQINFWGGGRVKTGTNTISIVSMDSSTNRTEALRHVAFPPTNPQVFTWDLNGNLASDGMKNCTWDEENRLVKIETINGIQGVEQRKSEYLYDGQSKRIQKNDYSGWTNGAYSITNSTKFIYDGWNLISEISHTDTPTLSCSVTNSYVWGQDLSGSLQGAGGVGGLLAVIRFDTNSLQPTVYFPVYDGNGNITDYVNTNGVVVAHREYDPFGNTVVSTGPMKDSFNFWFSTKYYEPWWKLYYYGYRFYSPSLGRWLSRDPIEEVGFRHVNGMATKLSLQFIDLINGGHNHPYLFVSNSSVNKTDLLGLQLILDCEAGDPCRKDSSKKFDVCITDGDAFCSRGKCILSHEDFRRYCLCMTGVYIRCARERAARNRDCTPCVIYNDGKPPMYFPIRRVPPQDPSDY